MVEGAEVMEAPEFKAWPKTPRLFRDVAISEKIDGTNAAVIVTPLADVLPKEGIFTSWEGYPAGYQYAERWIVNDGQSLVAVDGDGYIVAAQSRTRLITPGKSTDNFGFAAWVAENAEQLVALLGPGRHFGEWWGKGIQRNYGLDERRFSLFNTGRYQAIDVLSNGLLHVVPHLWSGTFSTAAVENVVSQLAAAGSWAEPGFMKPEGVVVYHTAARQSFKVLIDNDEIPKGETS